MSDQDTVTIPVRRGWECVFNPNDEQWALSGDQKALYEMACAWVRKVDSRSNPNDGFAELQPPGSSIVDVWRDNDGRARGFITFDVELARRALAVGCSAWRRLVVEDRIGLDGYVWVGVLECGPASGDYVNGEGDLCNWPALD